MSNQLSWSIYKRFSTADKPGFTFQDVVREFPEKLPSALSRELSDMVTRGMLCKIARGNYLVIHSQIDSQTYMPSGLQMAKYIMKDKDYYIGYTSAMRIHEILVKNENGIPGDNSPAADNTTETEAQETMVKVVTLEQVYPAMRDILGITCHFIQHQESRFFGYERKWIIGNEKAMVSDLEKTIVDATTKPQHCGGIIEVGHFLKLSSDQADQNTLYYYFGKNANKSAKKRFLFLSDLLGLKWTKHHDNLMEELGTGISLLDPTAPNQGKRLYKFGLRINVDPGELRKKILPG